MQVSKSIWTCHLSHTYQLLWPQFLCLLTHILRAILWFAVNEMQTIDLWVYSLRHEYDFLFIVFTVVAGNSLRSWVSLKFNFFVQVARYSDYTVVDDSRPCFCFPFQDLQFLKIVSKYILLIYLVFYFIKLIIDFPNLLFSTVVVLSRFFIEIKVKMTTTNN